MCLCVCGGGGGGGMGRLQWHMLQFKLSLDPCSSGGPAGAQGGIHYNQTQAGFGQRLHRDASPESIKSGLFAVLRLHLKGNVHFYLRTFCHKLSLRRCKQMSRTARGGRW